MCRLRSSTSAPGRDDMDIVSFQYFWSYDFCFWTNPPSPILFLIKNLFEGTADTECPPTFSASLILTTSCWWTFHIHIQTRSKVLLRSSTLPLTSSSTAGWPGGSEWNSRSGSDQSFLVLVVFVQTKLSECFPVSMSIFPCNQFSLYLSQYQFRQSIARTLIIYLTSIYYFIVLVPWLYNSKSCD